MGCASAGNIIPLAARFPAARFHGIDISQAQIARGQKRCDALALGNLTLETADLADFAARLDNSPANHFDYIICHGVFSWVPVNVQTDILRILHRSLAPNGIAALSYNVLPGWQARGIVRDICLDAARGAKGAHQRVALARKALSERAAAMFAEEPYAAEIKSEAARLEQQPASYILGEYLSEHNTPFHFREIAERTRQHGLAYLCEADLPSTLATRPQHASAQGLDHCAGQALSDSETRRTFRRSLFVHAGEPVKPVLESASRGAIARLHLSSPVQFDPDRSRGRLHTFRDHKGYAFTTDNAAVRACYEALGSVYPSTLPGIELLKSAPERQRPFVFKGLLALVAQGRATLSAAPLKTGLTQSKPRLWNVARVELADRQPWLSTLRHTAVAPPKEVLAAMETLDGTRTVAELDVLAQATTTDASTREQAPTPAAAIEFARYNGLLE